MKKLIFLALVLVLMFAVAAPAFAVNGSSGAGRAYGEHVVEHAKTRHFGQDMNPGMHEGFAGYDEHHEH